MQQKANVCAVTAINIITNNTKKESRFFFYIERHWSQEKNGVIRS
jgi:hypothetical protein